MVEDHSTRPPSSKEARFSRRIWAPCWTCRLPGPWSSRTRLPRHLGGNSTPKFPLEICPEPACGPLTPFFTFGFPRRDRIELYLVGQVARCLLHHDHLPRRCPASHGHRHYPDPPGVSDLRHACLLQSHPRKLGDGGLSYGSVYGMFLFSAGKSILSDSIALCLTH